MVSAMGVSFMSNRDSSSRSGKRIDQTDMHLLMDAVTDRAIIMLDPQGVIQSWNAGAEALMGYTAEEILGRHFSLLYLQQETCRPELELMTAHEQGSFEEDGWRIRKDGTRLQANIGIKPLSDQQGRHRGFSYVVRGDSAVDKAEESQRIPAFIAMLAHELRNPLAPITNAVSLLEAQPNLEGSLIKIHNIIARQTRQLTRLVNDLLDMGRISEGRIQLEAKPVLLDEVIAESMAMIDPFLREQMHNVSIERSAEPLWVLGDRARLIQVAHALLHNAAKFTPRGGAIKVALAVENDIAVISVIDSGPGIDPGRLPQLFKRFAQQQNDSSKTFGGLGLGLSLAHELTRLQRGAITAHSSGREGEGSTFKVRLPRIAAPTLANDSSNPDAAKVVLIVDDNRDCADIVAMLLETMGYQCLTANTGKDAIEAVKRVNPGVVLLDIGLPDIDGHGVAQQIALEVANPPPLIAVTGYGQDKDREKSFKAGFHAHVTKPVDANQLEIMLSAIFAGQSKRG